MPEGPEIRRAADEIADVLVGREIVEADFQFPELKRFEARIAGSTVTAVDTRGKAMLTRFDNGLVLYSHNQLYGRWYTTTRPLLPRTQRQRRVALHTSTHSALLYSASDIEILDAATEPQHPFLRRVGPDILDPALTPAKVRKRLLSPPFRNRSLGSLYLDQSFLAGNGNYLRSEVLWAAGVHPRQNPTALENDALGRLARQTLTIARRSYRTHGVTAPAAAVRQRRARGMNFSQYRFQVYDRNGLECYACDNTIERLTHSSRSVFVCPDCQPG
jgi:endonuclease-8